MKRAAIYCRAAADQSTVSQLQQLRTLAGARGFEIVQEYSDRGYSVKARRPQLDSMMADARRGKFDVVLTSSLDQVAKSTRHFLQLINELQRLDIQFVSAKECIDTCGDMGQLFSKLCCSILSLERALSSEKIRQGMRRAKFDGQRFGRAPLDVDRTAIVRDRLSGMSLTNVARKHGISRASVVRFVREAARQDMAGVSGFPVGQAEVATVVECVA